MDQCCGQPICQPKYGRSDIGTGAARLDLGMRGTALADHLHLEAALYQRNWRNIQSDILLNSGLIGTRN